MSNWTNTGSIRAKFDEFQGLDVNTRWNAFGEICYPIVHKIYPEQASKITGMLIDYTVFQDEEILSNLEDKEKLLLLIEEAYRVLLESQTHS